MMASPLSDRKPSPQLPNAADHSDEVEHDKPVLLDVEMIGLPNRLVISGGVETLRCDVVGRMSRSNSTDLSNLYLVTDIMVNLRELPQNLHVQRHLLVPVPAELDAELALLAPHVANAMTNLHEATDPGIEPRFDTDVAARAIEMTRMGRNPLDAIVVGSLRNLLACALGVSVDSSDQTGRGGDSGGINAMISHPASALVDSLEVLRLEGWRYRPVITHAITGSELTASLPNIVDEDDYVKVVIIL